MHWIGILSYLELHFALEHVGDAHWSVESVAAKQLRLHRPRRKKLQQTGVAES